MIPHALIATLLLAQAAPMPAAKVVTLQQAIDSARERHPDLARSAADFETATARARELQSGLYPQVNINGSYTERTANAVPQAGGQFFPAAGKSPFTLYGGAGANAQASELLYDFGQTPNRWHSAQENAEAQKSGVEQTLSDVLLNAKTAYFSARAQMALVQVAKDTMENEQRHMDLVKAQVEIGQRAGIDLAQERAAVANDKLALIRAENNYTIAKARLNQAMGVQMGLDYDVQDETVPAVNGEDSSPDALFNVAYGNRPELAALAHQRNAAEYDLSVARGQFWPTVTATVTTNAGEANNNLGWNAAGILGFSWPIYEGGAGRARVWERESAIKSLDAQTESLKQRVEVDVEQAWTSVRAAKEEITAAADSLQASQERLKLAEGRYQAGAGSILELGDAQVAVANAAAQRVSADYDLATARAQLIRALGGAQQ